MEQKMQRAAIVSKFLVLFLLMIGCVSKKELIQTNDDAILNLYLKDIVATKKKDSIFIAPKNSNSLILNIQKDYLELKKDSFIKTPNKVLLNTEDGYKAISINKRDSIYNNIIDKPWVSIQIDSILHKVFSETESLNYNAQLSTGNWKPEVFSNFKNVYITNSKRINKSYISKPMYTLNKKYALIYHSSTNIYWYSLTIYENKNNQWKKVYTEKKPFCF